MIRPWVSVQAWRIWDRGMCRGGVGWCMLGIVLCVASSGWRWLLCFALWAGVCVLLRGGRELCVCGCRVGGVNAGGLGGVRGTCSSEEGRVEAAR